MLVFWDQRLVVLATPKTGSTALAAALESRAAMNLARPPVLKHTTVRRYRRFLGPYLEVASGNRFDVVALMREPRDWLGSWYRFRQRTDLSETDKSTHGRSFEEFVVAYCSDPQPAFAAVGSQAQFLQPRNGQGADRLFRYERMDAFVTFLEDRLECRIALPRLNVSPAAPLVLSRETEARLAARMAEDVALYAAIDAGPPA